MRKSTSRKVMPNFVLILINILLAVSGQALIKQGVDRVGSFSDMPLVNFFKGAVLSPLVILGMFLYMVSAFTWFMVLSKTDLSIAYPTLSLGYILILLIGALFLREPITLTKILGTLLICTGTFLIFKK